MPDRKSIRFQPDRLAVAQLDLKAGKEFTPTLVGLLLNESYAGCALVVAYDEIIKKNTKVKIKVGSLAPFKGEVVWIKTLEENIQKIGIRLLE